MQEKSGNFWKKCFSAKKTWIIIFIFLFLLVCAGATFFYFYGVQPLLAWATSTSDPIHHGLEFYTNNSYKDYEHSEHFAQILSDLDYVSVGEVVDFYHCENEQFDNPIHGKQWDVFSIDIQLDSAKYTKYKKEIDENTVYCMDLGDFDLYMSGHGEEYVVITAVCYNQNIIRVVFMPDFENVEEKIAEGKIINGWYFDILLKYLDFDYPPYFDYNPEYRKAGT